jgi:hypothetical protein
VDEPGVEDREAPRGALSPAAIEVLERQAWARVGDAVFSGRGGSPASWAALSIASRSVGFDIGNPHAWRSNFRDWAEDIGGCLAPEARTRHSLGAVEKASPRDGRRSPARDDGGLRALANGRIPDAGVRGRRRPCKNRRPIDCDLCTRGRDRGGDDCFSGLGELRTRTPGASF